MNTFVLFCLLCSALGDALRLPQSNGFETLNYKISFSSYWRTMYAYNVRVDILKPAWYAEFTVFEFLGLAEPKRQLTFPLCAP